MFALGWSDPTNRFKWGYDYPKKVQRPARSARANVSKMGGFKKKTAEPQRF